MKRLSLLSLAAAVAGAAPVLAQGADDCASAQAIAGAGPHAYDNTAATTDGLPDPLCDAFGQDDIENDVWFLWTAAMTAEHTVSFCGTATNDTRCAVYDGVCGGAIIACNDDVCGLQSEVDFDAVSGTSYLIRVGGFPGSAPGAGTFSVTPNIPVFNPNNGHYYELVSEQFSWPQAKLEAEASTWQGSSGHLVTIEDQAELDWILANLAPSRPWIGLFHDTTSPQYAEPDMGWAWVTGEPTNFLNWSGGEPNDTSASGGAEDYCEMFANGAWNDAEEFHAQTNQYLIEWDGGLGMNYCMANANASGGPAVMSASGSNVVANNDFHVTTTGMPTNTFGFYITSRTQTFVANPAGSAGNLCLGNPIGRFQLMVQNSGAGGTFGIQPDLTSFPNSSGAPIVVQSGDTWNFQAWFRDSLAGSATSNFSDGLEVSFQ